MEPDTESKRITYVYNLEALKILGEVTHNGDEWWIIDHEKGRGYVRKTYTTTYLKKVTVREETTIYGAPYIMHSAVGEVNPPYELYAVEKYNEDFFVVLYEGGAGVISTSILMDVETILE
jgi:hypothetical protein